MASDGISFPVEAPDPEQLIKDWRGMALEFGGTVAGSVLKTRAKAETLKFCADSLQLWLREVQGQHVALLPSSVLAVLQAAMHLKDNDMQSLEDLIDAAQAMKFGAT